MSIPQIPTDDQPLAESHLGRVLALVHRILPRLDEPERKSEVQSALRLAASLLEAARQSHEGAMPPAHAALGLHKVSTGVDSQIAAVIAAAVSVVLDRPYRLVSVQQVTVPVVPHLNVWAVEGRTQIFMSHKVR